MYLTIFNKCVVFAFRCQIREIVFEESLSCHRFFSSQSFSCDCVIVGHVVTVCRDFDLVFAAQHDGGEGRCSPRVVTRAPSRRRGDACARARQGQGRHDVGQQENDQQEFGHGGQYWIVLIAVSVTACGRHHV